MSKNDFYWSKPVFFLLHFSLPRICIVLIGLCKKKSPTNRKIKCHLYLCRLLLSVSSLICKYLRHKIKKQKKRQRKRENEWEERETEGMNYTQYAYLFVCVNATDSGAEKTHFAIFWMTVIVEIERSSNQNESNECYHFFLFPFFSFRYLACNCQIFVESSSNRSSYAYLHVRSNVLFEWVSNAKLTHNIFPSCIGSLFISLNWLCDSVSIHYFSFAQQCNQQRTYHNFCQ